MYFVYYEFLLCTSSENFCNCGGSVEIQSTKTFSSTQDSTSTKYWGLSIRVNIMSWLKNWDCISFCSIVSISAVTNDSNIVFDTLLDTDGFLDRENSLLFVQ